MATKLEDYPTEWDEEFAEAVLEPTKEAIAWYADFYSDKGTIELHVALYDGKFIGAYLILPGTLGDFKRHVSQWFVGLTHEFQWAKK
jgi:hypothetical protein